MMSMRSHVGGDVLSPRNLAELLKRCNKLQFPGKWKHGQLSGAYQVNLLKCMFLKSGPSSTPDHSSRHSPCLQPYTQLSGSYHHRTLFFSVHNPCLIVQSLRFKFSLRHRALSQLHYFLGSLQEIT